MIDNMFKRALAYLFDMMLVSLVVSSIVSSSVNPQLEKYQDIYNDYYETYLLYSEHVSNDIKECSDLEKAIDEEKLTEDIYIDNFNELKDQYDKDKITEDEYKNTCSLLVDDYNEHKITYEEYEEKFTYYYERLENNSVFNYCINIGSYLLYFVLFQGFTKGQTLGKKLFKIKVVSKDSSDVTYKQLFFRTLFLYSIVPYILMIITNLILSGKTFLTVGGIVTNFANLLNLVIILGVCITSGKRGLHDLVVKTKVIRVDFKGNELVEEVKQEEIKIKKSKIKK